MSAVLVGGHQRDQHPRGHPREAPVGEDQRQLLDESPHLLRRRDPATQPSISSPTQHSQPCETSVASDTRDRSDLRVRPGQDVRAHPGPRRARPDGRAPGEVHGFLGPERRRASRPPSASCSACCAPTPAPSGCSAATRGATPSRCTAGSPTCPATSTLWPNLTGGEVDRPARPAARRPRPAAPRRAARALRARPDQEGPRLLQGQPAEGRAGRRAAPPTSSCCILDEPTSGLDPLMEAVFQRVRRARSATRAARCCCPATSWPRSRRCATGSPSSAPAGRSRPARWPSCGTSPAPSIDGRDWRGRSPAWPALPGVHDLRRRRRPGALRGRHRPSWTPVLRAADRGRRAQPDQPAADPGGAVPAPLRRRAGRAARAGAAWRGMTGWAPLLRLALRRDRIMLPVWISASCCRSCRPRRSYEPGSTRPRPTGAAASAASASTGALRRAHRAAVRPDHRRRR